MTSLHNFLGLDEPLSDFDRARVLVLPIPLEATVSFAPGAGAGPDAIVSASQQVELYDREYDSEPVSSYGIHTLPALHLPADVEHAVRVITDAVNQAAETGKMVVALGGEHTVSVGVGRGLLAALPGPMTIVQIDAHSDLRDEYDGTPYSHACVARRLLEDSRFEQLLQFGIRSQSSDEVAFARSQPTRIRIWHSEDVHAGGWQRELRDSVRGRNVYLTIDVDGLDPALIAATGTPEPDGLTWIETLEIIREISQCATIIAIDCVELAPVAGFHASDFAAAKLVYKAITYAMRGNRPAELIGRATETTYGGLANDPDLWTSGASVA
jgi:agmatinase